MNVFRFSIFADLFDEMVRQGSSAVQTQHPGFYYQLAAKHASDRRVIASQLCSVSPLVISTLFNYVKS
jgi:hypothetical protein